MEEFMRARSLTLAALGATILAGTVLPAFAENWRQERREERREWRQEQWREHNGWRPGYYAPPVVVAPPAYSYYTPPPVYYGPSPGVNFGVTIR